MDTWLSCVKSHGEEMKAERAAQKSCCRVNEEQGSEGDVWTTAFACLRSCVDTCVCLCDCNRLYMCVALCRLLLICGLFTPVDNRAAHSERIHQSLDKG